MPVAAFEPWTWYVGALHANCQDTGRVDPVPTSTLDWIQGDDTGTSSKAIYYHMTTGRAKRETGFGNYPYDPSDFGRCYRLLQLAPEWRARLPEMAAYGKQWAALAAAWDTLTELYEKELPNGTAPKLYDKMKELTR